LFAFVLVLLEDLRGLFDELPLFDLTYRVIYFILQAYYLLVTQSDCCIACQRTVHEGDRGNYIL
jgi:hypothetical protein